MSHRKLSDCDLKSILFTNLVVKYLPNDRIPSSGDVKYAQWMAEHAMSLFEIKTKPCNCEDEI